MGEISFYSICCILILIFYSIRSMKTVLIIFFFIALTHNAMSKIAIPYERNDSVVTVVDSLAFNYNVKKMTVILNGIRVHYSVIFKEDEPVDKKYKFLKGAMDPLDAIKGYGEKYRNGILIYKKEESNE